MPIKRPGRVFLISAPSGTGKSTVIKRIMEMRHDLVFSVSATTRTPRRGEINGCAYIFLSHEEFRRMIEKDEFLEHAEYVGNYYGTPKKPILKNISAGVDTILDIDVQGVRQVKKVMPEAVTIFLVPPSMEELEHRLRVRGTDSEEKMLCRLERAKLEFGELDKYDHIVVNDVVDRAAEEILSIMDARGGHEPKGEQ